MSIRKIVPYLPRAVQNPSMASVRLSGEDKAGANGGISSDRVQFSRGYRDLTKERNALIEAGDIRTEKVKQVTNQLSGELYQIHPTGIADIMLEEVM
jgi:anti-sigma28 factor (negative regulator of flagellin synthesis)